MIQYLQASTPEHIQQARELFLEYQRWLGVDLCFQGFERELAELPGEYAPPGGRLLLVKVDDKVAGCVALHRLGEGLCEMKRLYLRPEFQGHGLGRQMVEKLIDVARSLGYHRMRLDTIAAKMQSAVHLYRNLGFREIQAYRPNPEPSALYMELNLDQPPSDSVNSQR